MNKYVLDAKQIKIWSKTKVCKECTHFQKYINKIDESFDSPPDNEHTFSESYFHKKPIVDLQTIEERIKSTNLHRVQKKRWIVITRMWDRYKSLIQK